MAFSSETQSPTGISHRVSTSLGSLHVSEIGEGPETIVLWPSIFTDSHIYDAVVSELGERFRFLLIDGPAHGLSEGPSAEFTMEACADAMASVLDQFGLGSAVVGGTSWGGMTAAELAIRSPERVKALILMNTPTEIDGSRPSTSARFIAFGARWILQTQMFRNGVANSFFSSDALNANPGYAAQFHAMLRSAKPAPLAAAIRSVMLRGSPLRERLAVISAPTLVIGGRDDGMYPIDAQAKAASLLPNGHFEAVPGRHISPVECPSQVATLIERFVSHLRQAD
ncbi:MAG: alpha/beta fold hydrolase [Pseudomonadota bacterium]